MKYKSDLFIEIRFITAIIETYSECKTIVLRKGIYIGFYIIVIAFLSVPKISEKIMKKTNKLYEVVKIVDKFAVLSDLSDGLEMKIPKYKLPIELKIGETIEMDKHSMFQRISKT